MMMIAQRNDDNRDNSHVSNDVAEWRCLDSAGNDGGRLDGPGDQWRRTDGPGDQWRRSDGPDITRHH